MLTERDTVAHDLKEQLMSMKIYFYDVCQESEVYLWIKISFQLFLCEWFHLLLTIEIISSKYEVCRQNGTDHLHPILTKLE